VDTDWFIASQIESVAPLASPSENARLVALQLGNAYGLLFLVGVAVLYTTSELKVVRNYLVALLYVLSLALHCQSQRRSR
jgi:hypothetical protein